ncbi:hypothetical protein BDF19DRAFT_453139 [Syncephalis fuscata]|nr:hypothetical protein BDF19DRAFT_453139 [Syncephalis fuscata]
MKFNRPSAIVIFNSLVLLFSLDLISARAAITPESQRASTFLQESLNKPNAFFKNSGITITKLLPHPANIPFALGKYNKKDVHIICPNNEVIRTGANKRFLAYNSLIMAGKNLRGVSMDGREFLTVPLLSIPLEDGRCYITESYCEKSVITYTSGMSAMRKALVVPKLMEQIMRGIAYLHRAGRTYGNLSPNRICVNLSTFGKPKVRISGYEESMPLDYDQNGKPRRNNPRDQRQDFYSMKKDTQAIGRTIYEMVSATRLYWEPSINDFRDEFFFNAGTSKIPAAIGVATSKQIMKSLVDKIKLLMDASVYKVPTPQKYLEQYKKYPLAPKA